MEDETLRHLLKNTYSMITLYERLAHMKEYYELRLYGKGREVAREDLRTYFEHKHVDPVTVDALVEWSAYFNQMHLSDEDVYHLLARLHEKASSLSSVRLYVPILFDDAAIKGFCEWFRSTVDPNVVLEVKVDHHTVGGCAFVWKNVYHDFSLRYFMKKNRSELFHMMDSYAPQQ